MADRRGRAASVDTAMRAADRRRRLELSQQSTYAPLPMTRDRLNWSLDSTSLPGQYKPNISKSQAFDFIQARRQPFASYFTLPTEQERNALLINARRAQSVDARYAATVETRGDINSVLALHPTQDLSKRLLSKDLWPTSYTEESEQVRAVLIEGAVQPELPLLHKGASVDPKEPATAESDAFMDDLFDFDGAIEAIEATGQANEAGLAKGNDGDAARDAEGDGMMEEL